MGLDYDDTLKGEEEWVSETMPRLKGINNVKTMIGKEIPTLIELVHTKHKEIYDRDLFKQAMDYARIRQEEQETFSSESDDDLEARRLKHIVKKKNVKQTVVHSLHYDRKWLKLKVCLEMLQIAGYNILDDKVKTKIEWNKLHDYCRNNEEIIRGLFDINRKVWKQTLDSSEKNSLSKYVNSKLEKMLAIHLKTTSSKNVYHKIDFLYKQIGRQQRGEVDEEFYETDFELLYSIPDEDEFPIKRLLSPLQ